MWIAMRITDKEIDLLEIGQEGYMKFNQRLQSIDVGRNPKGRGDSEPGALADSLVGLL